MDHDPALDVPAGILALDSEEMRRLGYWVVDRTIEHLTTLDHQPAVKESSSVELRSVLGGPLPRVGHHLDPDLTALADVALANQQHGEHPRYFARVASPASYPAILADWLGTGMQSVASSWGGGSGTTTVELVALEWLREAIGLAPTSEGVLLSGGSMANITGIITARHENGDGVIYLADQTHSSIGRSLPAIGQPTNRIRTVGTDDRFRMSATALQLAIEADVADGLRPSVVVATAGTTNTGAVDDLPALSAICRAHGVWLHVDGAYGGPAAMSARGRAVMPGLDLVDSFVMDPHKWLFQPYDVACLYVREPGALERTFAMYPEYLADLDGREVDLHNRSLELSRRSRALKLWLTLRYYGTDVLAQAIERGIALAEYAQRVVAADPRLEIVTPAQLGIINFAAVGASDEDHRRAVAELTAEGRAATSSTVLRGRTVFRLCIINPSTTTDDLDVTIDRLATLVQP
ncbi:MAG: aminotransferase class I/II-fold pyridoxal phosphate-dependent enzyme [Actinomycetes bacterium]